VTRAFASWAVRRLFGLISRGVGLVSTLATVVLFVIPAYVDDVSRWWALVPLTAYVIVALLHVEYERVSGPCLNAKVEVETEPYSPGAPRHQYFIRIENCGPIPVEDVACELPEQTGWDLHETERIPVIDPGDSIRMIVFTSIGRDAQVSAALRGSVGDKPYERSKLLSMLG
jgi:hypothetical protein